MQNDKRTQFLTRTAMLLAMTLVFQNLRLFIGTSFYIQFIIGSLVNAALIVSVGKVNVYSGLIIGVLAPIVAFIQGQIPLPLIIPVVAGGNAIYVFLFRLVKNKNLYAAVVAGAIFKYIFMFIGIVIVLKIFSQVPEQKAEAIMLSFSWPQLITALIGGFLGLFAIRSLRYTWK